MVPIKDAQPLIKVKVLNVKTKRMFHIYIGTILEEMDHKVVPITLVSFLTPRMSYLVIICLNSHVKSKSRLIHAQNHSPIFFVKHSRHYLPQDAQYLTNVDQKLN